MIRLINLYLFGPAAAQPPGAPTNLTATANGQTRIDLSWRAPANNGGAAITGYRVEVSTDGSSWSNLAANSNSAAASYSDTGLTAGSARRYRVSAINSAGTGPASNAASATTDSAPGGASPDLVVQSPTVSDSSPGEGASFTLRATVRNRGSVASGTTARLRYYRSSDSTISTSDTQVGTDQVGGLAASGTSNESIDLTAPSSAGTYYYGACVDPVSGESDTGNNCSGAVAGYGGGACRPGRWTGHGQQPQPGCRSGLHPERHGAQPGQRCFGAVEAGLLPLRRLDHLHQRHAGGHGPGGRPGRVRDQQRVHRPDRAVERGDVLLRRVRGPVVRGIQHRQQLLGRGGGYGGGASRPGRYVLVRNISDDVWVSNISLDAGAPFTLRATVRNRGSGESATTRLVYYRSDRLGPSPPATRSWSIAVWKLSPHRGTTLNWPLN